MAPKIHMRRSSGSEKDQKAYMFRSVTHRLMLLPTMRKARTKAVSSKSDQVLSRPAHPRITIARVLARPDERHVRPSFVWKGIGDNHGSRVFNMKEPSIIFDRENTELKYLDPFVMMNVVEVSPPAGSPDHPHRGIETFTYMLEGAFTHQDSMGHKRIIQAGDAQWMTAGKGIMHSEMPVGKATALQLWINLSSNDKMIEPYYQEQLRENIARAEGNGFEVRILAGESMGVHSPCYTQTLTMFLDFTLEPGAQMHQRIPKSWNAFVYTMAGEGYFGSLNSPNMPANYVLVLGPGDGLNVWNKSLNPLRFILIGGQPLNEPVAQYGPLVMNTQAEIDQTFQDLENCKNGFEMFKTWRSDP